MTIQASARSTGRGYKAVVVRTKTLPSGAVRTTTEVVAVCGRRSTATLNSGALFLDRESAVEAAQRQIDLWAERRIALRPPTR
jgi:hypothetical protein